MRHEVHTLYVAVGSADIQTVGDCCLRQFLDGEFARRVADICRLAASCSWRLPYAQAHARGRHIRLQTRIRTIVPLQERTELDASLLSSPSKSRVHVIGYRASYLVTKDRVLHQTSPNPCPIAYPTRIPAYRGMRRRPLWTTTRPTTR